MVEYRQRLRVMLSASQGKYELERSSGSIAKDIKYVYYFTYFHEYSEHPFWDEFEPIIQSCLCVLRTRICCLSRSYCKLYVGVWNVHYNVKSLTESIDTIEKSVECSITRLDQHIGFIILKNAYNIGQSITNIACNLCSINSNLKCYIKCELERILKEFKQKTEQLQEKIKLTKHTILFYITQIVLFQRLILSITETFRGYIYKKGSKDGSSYTYYEYVQEEGSLYQYQERFSIEAEIQAKLQIFKDIEQRLKQLDALTLNGGSPKDLDQAIKQISEYTETLTKALKKIQQWREHVTKIVEGTTVKELPEENHEQIYYSGTYSRSGKESREYWVYHEYTTTIKKYFAKYQAYLSQRVTLTLTYTDNLQEQIKNTNNRLKNLVAIVVLYKQMNYCLCNFQKVILTIKTFPPQCRGRPYYTINKCLLAKYAAILIFMKTTVKVLLCILCSCASKTDCCCCCNKIEKAVCVLLQIKSQLYKLYKYGYNIGSLSYLTRAIDRLNTVRCSINGLEGTMDKLGQDKDTLYPKLKILDSIGTDLQVLRCVNLCDHYDLGGKLEKIEGSSLNIVKLNNDLECIEKLEVLKLNGPNASNSGNGLDCELEEFKQKLSCICINLNRASCHLKTYSQMHHRCYCVIEAAIKDIECLIGEIPQMQKNIEQIKTQATTIRDEYQKYTSNFKSFRDSLLKVQRCLDYLVETFLNCSIGTTICNLKRQIGDTSGQCPETNTRCECKCCDSECNSCVRQSLLGDRVTKLEQQLRSYSRLVLGHTSILESRLLVSRLYNSCVVSYNLMIKLNMFEKCRCVKVCDQIYKPGLFKETKVLTPHNIRHVCNHSDFHRKRLDQAGNHVCLCLLVMYKLYPSIAKCLCSMVDMELELANVMTKKLQRYNTLKGVYFSLTKLFIMAIKIIDKITECMTKKYFCDHDTTNCHCNPNKVAKCICDCKKNGADECCCYICFCCYWEDSLYPWFVSLIVWMAWLLDNLFSLRYSDVQQSIQLLSNLMSEIDSMCCDRDKKPKPEIKSVPAPYTKPAKPSVVGLERTTSYEASLSIDSKPTNTPRVSLESQTRTTRTSAMSVSSPIPTPKPASSSTKNTCCSSNTPCNLCVNYQALYRVITMARQTFYWVSFEPVGVSISGIFKPKVNGGKSQNRVVGFSLTYVGIVPFLNRITLTYYKVLEKLLKYNFNICQHKYFMEFLSYLSFKLLTHESINPVTGYKIRYVLKEQANRYMSLLEVKPKPGAQQQEPNECLEKNCSICKKGEISVKLLNGIGEVLKQFLPKTNSQSGSAGTKTEQQTKEDRQLQESCKCKNCCLICLQSGDIILFITQMLETIDYYARERKAQGSGIHKDTLMYITETLSVTQVYREETNTKCQCTLVFEYFNYLLDALRTRQVPTTKPEPEGKVTITAQSTIAGSSTATVSKAPPTKEATSTVQSNTTTPSTTPSNNGDPVIYVGLKKMLEEFFGQDYFKCGCESVRQCCCCCKCDECGNGKGRKCNEKGCGHTNGTAPQGTGAQGTGNGHQGTQAESQAGNGQGQGMCPCTEGNNGKKDGKEKQCCCQGADGKKCNCTKDKAKPATTAKECRCCCLSCCADKDEEEQQQPQAQTEGQNQQPDTSKNCPCKKKKKKDKPKKHCKNNKKYKDKRCCCKCCPKENGGEGANGGGATNGEGTTPKDNKDCCCCCKCKSTCKGAAGTSAGGGSSNGNGCKCPNGKDTNGKPCKCYCCFDCDHKKSALRSVCKHLAYDLKSSILVMSKLASNMTIECCEDDQEKLNQTLTKYLDQCNQRFPKTCLTATRTGRGCDISHVMVGGKTSLRGGNSVSNPNIGDTQS